jgi:putative endonuclease
MLYYAYILRCADGRLYYGSTGDLRRRLRDHQGGRVRSTRRYLPVRLVWFEHHATADAAKQRERSLKNGRTRREKIEAMIDTFPQELLAPFARPFVSRAGAS